MGSSVTDAQAGEEQDLEALDESLNKTFTRYEMEISDDTQRIWDPEVDQGKRANAGYSYKLQVPRNSCFR